MSAAPLSLEAPLQACGNKLAPLADAVSASREGRGGVNVHTDRNICPKVYRGTTAEWEERLRSVKKAKLLIQTCESLRKAGYEKESKALLGCGRWFRAGILPCGTVKVLPLYCDSPFCTECARRRAKPYQQKIWNLIKRDKKNLFFMTFTLKSVSDLTRGDVDRLVQAFKELRERDEWKACIEGGFYSIECTYNEGTGWHPHLHVLLKAKGRIPREWLDRIKANWRFITGDSYFVHIQRAYGVLKNGKKSRRINERAVKELVKYSTKSATFAESPERVGEFLDAFKNVRRMQSFGCFFRVNKEIEKEAAPDEKVLAGCVCGGCAWGQLHLFATVHVRDTVLRLDGLRELSPEFVARADLLRHSVEPLTEVEESAAKVLYESLSLFGEAA